MRPAPAVGLTALAGICGTALLATPLLPQGAASAALASHDAALQLAAARAAFAADIPAARATGAVFALRAIDARPLNQPALALATEAGAVTDRTAALNLGAALGWRDALTNARLAGLALASGETVIAAQRIDAIGRTLNGETAAAAADALMAQPGGPQALAARAGNRTGGLWWIVYLRQPAANPAALAGRAAFAASLEADDGPWRRDIIEATLFGIGQSPVPQADKHALSLPLQAMLQ